MYEEELGRIHKNTYNLRGFKRTFIFIVVSAVLVGAATVVCWNQVTRRLSQDARESIVSVGQELAENFNYLLESEFQTLSAVAVPMENPAFMVNKERLVNYLGRQNKKNAFDITGFQDLNGASWFSNGAVRRDFLSPEEIEQTFQQGYYLSSRRRNPFDGGDVLVFAVPVEQNTRRKGVVFATHSIGFYAQTLSANLWQGNGVVMIMEKNGDIVFSYPRVVYGNILETAKKFKYDKPFGVQNIQEDVSQRKRGWTGYSLDGEHRFSSYHPLDFNEWYVFAVLPTAFVAEKAASFLAMAWIICFAVIAVMGASLLFIFRMQRRNGKALYQMGFVDALTQSDNLNAFHSKYTQTAEHFSREGIPYALAVVNIDRFKAVNDIYGLEQGDKILQQVAAALREGVGPNELFCRSSADEFLLLLACPGRAELGQRLEELVHKAGRFCQENGRCLPLSLTCGVYLVDEQIPFYIMVDRAKLALVSARQKAGSVYAFYDEEFRRRIVAEKHIESYMEEALQNGEFKLYLQPKCDFKTGRVKGAEALVRWDQAGKGLVSPDNFVPIFEKNGFILKLDMFMLEETLRLLKQWEKAGLQPVPVGINFSRLHLQKPSFVDVLAQRADAYGVAHGLLEAELTESIVFGNTATMKNFVEDMHSQGFSVAMDDFGSGYSSLNVLKNLAFDCVKLDKEFLVQDQSDLRMKTILSGLVRMIKRLGGQIVAEGVETPQQAEFLRKIGCDLAQGYLFYRPLPPEEFEKLLHPFPEDKPQRDKPRRKQKRS